MNSGKWIASVALTVFAIGSVNLVTQRERKEPTREEKLALPGGVRGFGVSPNIFPKSPDPSVFAYVKTTMHPKFPLTQSETRPQPTSLSRATH
jgi:hypothetical protein